MRSGSCERPCGQERGLSDAATSQGVPRLASGHLRLGETRREGPFLRGSGGNTALPTPQLWGAWLSDGENPFLLFTVTRFTALCHRSSKKQLQPQTDSLGSSPS